MEIDQWSRVNRLSSFKLSIFHAVMYACALPLVKEIVERNVISNRKKISIYMYFLRVGKFLFCSVKRSTGIRWRNANWLNSGLRNSNARPNNCPESRNSWLKGCKTYNRSVDPSDGVQWSETVNEKSLSHAYAAGHVISAPGWMVR